MSHRRETTRSLAVLRSEEVTAQQCQIEACSLRRWRVCGRPGCLHGTSYAGWTELKRRAATFGNDPQN